jgi:hypothetical protein
MQASTVLLEIGGPVVAIQNNTADGVVASIGSRVEMGIATIQGNQGNGLSLLDTSVAIGGPNSAIQNNGGWGVFCSTAPGAPAAQISGTGQEVITGNAAGQVSCPNTP